MTPSLPPPCPPSAGVGRRAWLALAGAGAFAAWGSPEARALSPRTLAFPRDHGSHPQLRTEWWYITGHARAQGRLWGFQITFFRSRVDAAQALRSAFAARQLLFAHAAITDVAGQRLLHDQRIARAGFGIAEASTADTRVQLRDWRLVRSDAEGSAAAPRSRYHTHIRGEDFGLELDFLTTQPLLLQGAQGLSRKGPEPEQASYYYSQPQMSVAGTLQVAGERLAVEPGTGRAWLDHECSEALMHPEAVGWDWIGMNLDDASTLTAFRLRRADGSALWAGGSWRRAGGATEVFGPQDVVFTPLRHWRSPMSQANYPVAWRVQTPRGTFEVQALLDAQELDSRASTGAIYWEGLCALHTDQGAAVGRGYLEMTGYAQALRL